MAKRIYVGNLGYDVSSLTLEGLFKEFGTVTSAEVVIDQQTGESRGFAFVEMANDNEAQAAIAALDKRDIEGRPIAVNEAKPRTSFGNRGGGGGYRGGGGGGGGGGYRGGGFGGGRDRRR